MTNPTGPISEHPLEDLAAHALDALDTAERRIVDDHVATCATCRDELAGYHETLATLAPAEVPPPAVWERIAAVIDAPDLEDPHTTPTVSMILTQERTSEDPTETGRRDGDDTIAPVTSLAETARARSRRAFPLRRVVSVAAGLLVAGTAGAVLGFVLGNASDDASIGSLAQQASEDPDGVLATLENDSGQPVARVVADEDGAFVLLEGLQDLPEGRAYQLWALDGPQPVSLGMLGRDGTNTVAFRLPPTTSELAISVAPTSGDPAPTGEFRASGSVSH